VGKVLFRARDMLGLRSWEGEAGEARPLRVFPREVLSVVSSEDLRSNREQTVRTRANESRHFGRSGRCGR
jgi:hypothetical protein